MSGTLPRIKEDPTTVNPVSATRSVQINTALEAAWNTLFPAGVVLGGLVAWTTGYSVQVLASTFLSEGVLYVLAAPQAYTAAEPSTNVRLWGCLQRTAAAQGTQTALDTWQLTLKHTKGASYLTPPAAPAPISPTLTQAFPWIPLADWLTDGSGVLNGAIDNGVLGKYLKAASPLWQGKRALAAADVACVAAGEQFSVIGGSLQVRGRLLVRGALRVR